MKELDQRVEQAGGVWGSEISGRFMVGLDIALGKPSCWCIVRAAHKRILFD